MPISTHLQSIDSLVAKEIARRKLVPAAELDALGQTGVTVLATPSGEAIEITTWVQPTPASVAYKCAVLVGAWRKLPLGVSKLHLQGFFVGTDGTRTDIPPDDLWQYD